MNKKKPKKIPAYIRKFCNKIFTEKPLVVPIKPLPEVELNECFPIVESHVKGNGGKQVYGWCIHVWRKVLIEAEFHCVWQTPDGKLIDITPKKEKGAYIVFIPDPEKIYNGQQVNNIRKSLTSDPDAIRFIELFDKHFKLTNEGDLADRHGLISIDTQEFHELAPELISIESRLKKKYGNRRVLY